MLARQAGEAGADAVMALPPYYASPCISTIRNHYVRVAGECGLPIVVYNNPARTNINMDADVLLKLAEIEQVVAVKDCDRDLARLSEKLRALRGRVRILSGEDDLAFPTLVLGATGGIWATVNLFPAIFVDMYQAVVAGNIDVARQYHYVLLPLWKACFVADHPAALKTAMAMALRPVGKARSPLASPSDVQVAAIRSALAAVEQTCADAAASSELRGGGA
jgi:4-hydroxy-tetrahydrodipicolinate synthase